MEELIGTPASGTPNAADPAQVSAPAIDQKAMDIFGLPIVQDLSTSRTKEPAAQPTPTDGPGKSTQPGAQYPAVGPDGKPLVPVIPPVRTGLEALLYTKEGGQDVFNHAALADLSRLDLNLTPAKTQIPGQAPAAAVQPAAPIATSEQKPLFQRINEEKFAHIKTVRDAGAQILNSVLTLVQTHKMPLDQAVNAIYQDIGSRAQQEAEETFSKKLAEEQDKLLSQSLSRGELDQLRPRATANIDALNQKISQTVPNGLSTILFNSEGKYGAHLVSDFFELMNPDKINLPAAQKNEALSAWFIKFASEPRSISLMAKLAMREFVAEHSASGYQRAGQVAKGQLKQESQRLTEAQMGQRGRSGGVRPRGEPSALDRYLYGTPGQKTFV